MNPCCNFYILLSSPSLLDRDSRMIDQTNEGSVAKIGKETHVLFFVRCTIRSGKGQGGERENRGARKSRRKCGKSPRSSAITLSVREIAADYKRTFSLSFALFLSTTKAWLSQECTRMKNRIISHICFWFSLKTLLPLLSYMYWEIARKYLQRFSIITILTLQIVRLCSFLTSWYQCSIINYASIECINKLNLHSKDTICMNPRRKDPLSEER